MPEVHHRFDGEVASCQAIVAALEAEQKRRRTPQSLGIGNQLGN